MNIAVIAPYDLARTGGVGSHVRAQARALRALGHTVRVIGPASAPLEHGETAIGSSISVTVGGTASGMGIDPRAAVRLRRIFALERFDIVHVHEPLMPAVPWYAVWLAPAPIVGTFHVHREQGHALYRVARPALAPLMRRLSARIAVSDAARRTVARYFPGEYEIVPNGVEVSRFQRARPRPPRLPESSATVLCVGRLEPRKGVAFLIDAMTRVQRDRPDAMLVVVGDGPARTRLQQLARDSGARVLFCANVDDEELPAWYQAADVVCAPAIGGESFGIVLLEAFASGKPVVASRIDGYTAVAGGASCARLVEPGDVDGLAHELSALLRDRSQREELTCAALAVASTYDWTVVARRLTDVYARVQRGSRGG